MVNLQITAMLAIFEFSYGLFYMMTYAYVSKGSSFGTLITGMTLHCVVLPFSFLMNTTDNKYRVVEIGWKNVFKNVVRGWINHAMRIFAIQQSDNGVAIAPAPTNENSTEETAHTNNGSRDNQLPEPKDNKKKARRKSSKNVSKTQPKCESSKIFTHETRNGDDGIYIISTHRDSSDSNPIENVATDPNVPFNVEPSTSFPENYQFIKHINSDDESSSFPNPNESSSTKQDAYQAISQNIIQIMKDSMEHENLYLDYFKKLLEVKEHMSNIYTVEIINIDQLFNLSEDENWRERCIVKLKMKGQKSERDRMRRELLNKLESCYQTKENNFDEFMSELIDLEEHFINDC